MAFSDCNTQNSCYRAWWLYGLYMLGVIDHYEWSCPLRKQNPDFLCEDCVYNPFNYEI